MAASERVMADNRGGLSRYLDEHLKVDLALAALVGLLAGLWGFNRFGYERVGGGEYELQPVSAVFAALVEAGLTRMPDEPLHIESI